MPAHNSSSIVLNKLRKSALRYMVECKFSIENQTHDGLKHLLKYNTKTKIKQ